MTGRKIDDRLVRDLVEGPARRQPPQPEWRDTLINWRASVDRVLDPPDLADCAPLELELIADDQRFLYHGSMRPVRTPAINSALKVVKIQLQANAERTTGRIGVIVQGARGTGKTALMQYIGRYYERRLNELYERDENRIPVIALSVPAQGRGGTRNWAAAFAYFLGLERDGGADPTRSICHVMRHAGTKLVLIDGIERLQHGADVRASFAFLDHISDETGATFVYCGRNSRAIVDPMTRDEETRREENEDPFGDHPVLQTSRLGYDQAGKDRFRRIVDEFDKDLRLFHHQRGDLTELSPVLHLRSKGYLRALSQLVCQAAQQAMLTKEERITKELLDTLAVGRVVRI